MKHPQLSALQTGFHNHLLDLPNSFVQEVIEGGRITVEHRLHIYHNAYRVRLIQALQDAFEKTWAYLGDNMFDTVARQFIEETPPQSRNLRWYGMDFPEWLAKRFPEDMDISELAMIDWQLRRAFDGPNALPIHPDQLAMLEPGQWETVGFRFAPTLFMAPLQYNTIAIWHALDQEQAPPAAERLPEPAWILIWRKEWQPHFRTLYAVEQAALSQLSEGTSFAEVCSRLSEQYSEEEAATVAAVSLRTWLQDELIIGLI